MMKSKGSHAMRTFLVGQWLRLHLETGGHRSDPWSGKMHMPRSNEAGTTTEPKCPRACAPQQKKPQRDTHTPQQEGKPALTATRNSLCSNKDPARPKVQSKYRNKIITIKKRSAVCKTI